jgi:ABC-type multidrug transport system ATPase subunit/pSer/pThr/pTyr-binding forkhead associated (FHA) protein
MNDRGLLGILQVQIAAGGQDELPLYQPALKVGRAKSSDVMLDDPIVSAQHARFTLGREGWQIEDVGSVNGTTVNGQRLAPGRAVPLPPGNVVQIGAFALQIRALRPGESPPPRLGEPVRITPNPQPGLVVYLQDQVFKFSLDKNVVTLGRGPDSDVQISDPLVSGHHARLERQGAVYRIVDLGSTNGLVYQGQRVLQHLLSDGDVLYIGPRIAVQYRAYAGFLPAAKKQEVPSTQFLDMRTLPKEGRRITIGRHPSNVLVLQHPRVSRYHAVIEQFGARFRLHDLNSDNGTFVNGKRVEKEAWIQEGDELRIGSYRLVFQEDGISHFDEAGNIRLDALRIEKWYSKTANILKSVSISIYPKEFVALVGASGAGKSTLMNAMTGFNPANGARSRVLVNGKNLYIHMDEYRSEMGYVPQEDIIHRELTVYRALDYAAQLRMPADTSRQERHQRIMEVLGELGLERQKNNLMTALSGGQRKRVSIGVELLTKPGLFFLDEATSGLDPGTETEMMDLLRDLADGGRTVILVTHATKNVMMCDQVVFLARGGYLAFFGPPNEALDYFESYRTPEERRYKEKVEFDDIYQLIESRGKPEEWGERFKQSPQYQRYVVQRLQELKEQQQAPTPAPISRQRRKRQVSAFRQFLILSARNLRIIAQDKIGLALMLAVAPMIGLMDFIWSRTLFDRVTGDAARIITMFFMMGLIGVLTGAISSVREIVKEVDIYRRERTVVLKLTPYILSKVWVGVILAAYQSVIFVLAKKIFVDPQFLGSYGYTAMYLTIFLCTLSGYMLGLLISAAAPNQNVALMLVVVVLVPQFLFAGALLPRDLIPGGDVISAAMSTRWAFESLVSLTGIGDDVVADPCWQMPKEQRDNLTQEDKDRLGCRCMGRQMFDLCYFPGILSPDFYNAQVQTQLNAPEPVKPPTPVPYPTLTPYPTPKPLPTPGLMDDQNAYAQKREKQGQDYQKKREEQGEEYRKLTEQQYTDYQDQMETYGEGLRTWQSDREKAVRGAEGMIDAIYKQYKPALEGDVKKSWLALGIISVVILALTMVFQKRKDVI